MYSSIHRQNSGPNMTLWRYLV